MMRMLLDTHVFLWWLFKLQLSPSAIQVISDEENEIFVSAVTGWEIVLKEALRKIDTPGDWELQIELNHFSRLPIDFHHFNFLRTLPFHRRDPFDRLLIAQALAEGMTIITRDRNMARYDVPIITA